MHRTPRDQSKLSDEIVVKILLQVVQCTYSVKEYCGDRRFGVHEYIQRSKRLVNSVCLGSRLLRDMTSIVGQQAKDYIENLQKLRRSLSEHADVSGAVTIYRVCGQLQAIGEAISLSSL